MKFISELRQNHEVFLIVKIGIVSLLALVGLRVGILLGPVVYRLLFK